MPRFRIKQTAPNKFYPQERNWLFGYIYMTEFQQKHYGQIEVRIYTDSKEAAEEYIQKTLLKGKQAKEKKKYPIYHDVNIEGLSDR